MSIIYDATNNRKGLIFSPKIPRTGGGATKKLLVETAKKNGINATSNRHCSRGTWEFQSNLKRNVSILNSGNYNLFTIVRNPWDRFISSLAYYTTSTKKGNFEKIFLKENKKLDVDKLKSLHNDLRKKPNSHLYYHVFTSMLSQIKDIKDLKILRYETLQEDISKYCHKLGLTLNLDDMETTNRFGYGSKRLHYSNYYTTESVDFVEFCFSQDISFFNYQFEKQG